MGAKKNPHLTYMTKQKKKEKKKKYAETFSSLKIVDFVDYLIALKKNLQHFSLAQNIENSFVHSPKRE